MSAFDRMQSIESRLAALDARISGEMPSAHPARGKSGKNPGCEGVTFEKLVNSLSENERFKGAAPTQSASSIGTWKGDPKDFDGMIGEASKKYNVEEPLIRAVIRQESAFNPKATSIVGAQGLMQLMPETAKGLGCTDAFDPYQNIMAGTQFLRQLLDRFDGNMTKVIAGYNAGPGAVEKYGGIPPYGETQNYVAKVMENYRNYKGMSI